jgi:serine/threonine-protein kinase HipA
MKSRPSDASKSSDNAPMLNVLAICIGACVGALARWRLGLWLSPGGRYRMTPLYDIVTAQPALNARQIKQKQMKLAMSVGDSRHYRFDQIQGRHFVQTALRGGLSRARAIRLIEGIHEHLPQALETTANSLPPGFPGAVVESVSIAAIARRNRLLTLEN